jgi:hypothetical protein
MPITLSSPGAPPALRGELAHRRQEPSVRSGDWSAFAATFTEDAVMRVADVTLALG